MLNNDPNLTAKALQFVTLASAFGKRAQDELSAVEQTREKVASTTPDLVEQMLKSGTIEAHQKQAAEQALSDHVQTLNVLRNSIAKIAELRGKLTQKQAGDLGHGVDPAKVEVPAPNPTTSLDSPFVGARSSTKRASDDALMRGLGLQGD